MKKCCCVLIGLMQLFSTSTMAQQQILDPITVSSSLTEKRTSETGRNITTIRGEDIFNLPVHSLDELLKYTPGVEVQSRGPQGAQSNISLRGGTYQQVLIILDGLRLNDPNTGHFSAYIPITPAQIERIEILKGASAAIYGSDAVGGVINVTTKTSGNLQQQNKKLIRGRVGAGQYHLVNTDIGGYLSKNRITADAGFLSNHSTGVQQRGIKGFFHTTTASAGIGYRVNEHWTLSARSSYDDRRFAAQNFYTTFLSDTATEKVGSWWHQLRASYRKNRSQLSLDAGYKKLEDIYAFNSAATANQNTSQLFQALLLFQQQLGEHSQLISGFNFQNKAIISNDRGNHTLNTAAPFAGISQKIGRYIHLLPSVRVEFIEENAAEVLPQLNFSFHKKEIQFRASAGRTIRDADFTERYNNWNKELVPSGSIGNPWLSPEVAWTYEAGMDWFYSAAFRLSSTFFQRFHGKLIDWVVTPYSEMPRKENLNEDGTYALAKNIASVNTTGFETDVQYIGRFSKRHSLILNGGLVWLYSKSSEANPSFYISSHARFLNNFSIIYQAGNVSIGVSGMYKSRNPRQSSDIGAYVSKDYFLLNGRASYGFLQQRLAVFAQADNLFNRRYSDLLGAPMPGRWLQAGLSFKFEK